MTSSSADKQPEELNNPRKSKRGAVPTTPLFVTDDDLHQLLSPGMGRDRFRAALRVAEAQGFPPTSPVWGGRYWPKVRAWLDNDNRLNDHDTAPIAQDGQEDFDAKPRRHTGTKAKSARPAVLDGVPGGERSQGLPRPFHTITGGR
jgi:hypothetical protein